MTYQRCWTVLACLLVVMGCTEAALLAPPATTISVGLAAALLTALCVQGFGEHRDQPPGARRVAIAALVAGVSVMALTGLVMLFEGQAVLLAGVMVLASPPVLRRAAQWLRRTSLVANPAGAVERTDDDVSWTPDVGLLTDTQLCAAWLSSSSALEALSGTGQVVVRARLVADRQDYLDELERRDAAGFRAWLYGGAGPASDPTPYLTRSDPA